MYVHVDLGQNGIYNVCTHTDPMVIGKLPSSSKGAYFRVANVSFMKGTWVHV